MSAARIPHDRRDGDCPSERLPGAAGTHEAHFGDRVRCPASADRPRFGARDVRGCPEHHGEREALVFAGGADPAHPRCGKSRPRRRVRRARHRARRPVVLYLPNPESVFALYALESASGAVAVPVSVRAGAGPAYIVAARGAAWSSKPRLPIVPPPGSRACAGGAHRRRAAARRSARARTSQRLRDGWRDSAEHRQAEGGRRPDPLHLRHHRRPKGRCSLHLKSRCIRPCISEATMRLRTRTVRRRRAGQPRDRCVVATMLREVTAVMVRESGAAVHRPGR